MKNLYLHGCGTALVTPFRGQSVDYEALSGLLDYQLNSGIHFLVPLGTTGEAACLENDEKLQVLECCRERMNINGRSLPMLVGAGTNSLKATLRNVKMLAPLADALLIVVPYYNKPTQRGQYEYFRAVAEESGKPIVLYNVPSRTGVNMEADTCLRLASDCPNIIGIKEASSRREQILRIIEGAPEGFSLFSGNDDEAYDLIKAGAAGVISVVSNIAPKLMAEMVENVGNERGESINDRLKALYHSCFVESSPIPVKAGLSAMGLMQNELRLPLCPASEETCALMRQTVEDLDPDTLY